MSLGEPRWFFALVSVLFLSSVLHAQIVGATINGTVRDSTGAAIVGASVTVPTCLRRRVPLTRAALSIMGRRGITIRRVYAEV